MTSRLLLSLPLLALATPALAAPALDTITFGNPASEQAHHLTDTASEVITGGFGETARRLKPLSPMSWNGGSVSFTLKVDPERQNYLTVKLWGGDKGEEKGRLILYLDGKQVGYRHEGEYDVLNQSDSEPIMQGRFLYQTLALPPMLTKGRHEVQLRIAGLGSMFTYAPNFQGYQHLLKEPTRGIYRVYTHTDTRFVPDAAERQGVAPRDAVRPEINGKAVLETLASTVNQRLEKLMTADPAPGVGSQEPMRVLAVAYHTRWTVAAGQDRAVAAIIRYGDGYVRKPNLDPANWIGAGIFGEAIARIGHHPLLDKALDQMVSAALPEDLAALRAGTPPVEQRMTRREAWARVLELSRDGHRFYGRRPYTNQSMIVDQNIYGANRGLQIVAPDRAMPEKEALRYLYESVGLLPWLGNDLPGGGHEAPYGPDYKVVTSKGLSRELGFVGTYGETILRCLRDEAEFSGDEQIKQQLVKIEATRMYFRYPSQDPDGYRQMKLTSEIDSRTAHFPLHNGDYNGGDVSELWWMEVPAFTRDPVSVGAAQQNIEDHQYFYRLAQRENHPDTLNMMRNVEEYATVAALPPSPFRLPMSPGQKDFVFSDEDDAVIAFKHGEDRLFINFYYRQEFAPSGSTRILEVQPAMMHIATVKAQVTVDHPAGTWVRPDIIDFERSGGMPPPGEDLHQAWAGEKLTIAARPAGASQPAYGDWGPFVGKASFYALRYGRYLIGLNTSPDTAHQLAVPAGGGKALDLVSGQQIDLSAAVSVPAHHTVILDLGSGGQ